MADKKISELTELTTPDGTEELVVNDSGVSKKVQIDNLIADNGLSGNKIDGGTISNFTSTGIDDNATSTAITIDASENVGIGTTLPLSNLHIEGLGNTVEQRIFTSDNVLDATASLIFGTTPGARTKAAIRMKNITTFSAGGDLLFETSQNNTLAERGRFTNNGYLRLSTASGGIQFNGDTAADNALDDYETGTWTPTLTRDGGTFAGTYSTQSGKYIKIGNQVFFTALVGLATITVASSGANTLTGLPFTAGISQQVGGISVMTSNIFATDAVVGGNIYNTAIYLRKPANVLAGTNLSENFTVGGFMISGVYTV